MDRFSMIVLERTAELINEVMEPQCHPGIAHCLQVIFDYVEQPAFADNTELHDAVIRLLDIAREKQQVLIAARLASIVTRLSETCDPADAA